MYKDTSKDKLPHKLTYAYIPASSLFLVLLDNRKRTIHSIQVRKEGNKFSSLFSCLVISEKTANASKCCTLRKLIILVLDIFLESSGK